jgi:hypothetical protein
VESIKKISLFLLTVFYLFLSTGVTLLKTHCLCSDSTRISLYTETKSCNDAIPEHTCCEEVNSCESCNAGHDHHTCGCDSPVVTYLKLTDHFGEDSELEYPLAKQLTLMYFSEVKSLKTIAFSSEPTIYPDNSPPENPLYGRNLINFLHQRKIALFV